MWKGEQSLTPLLRIDNKGLYISGAINCEGGASFKGEVYDQELNNLVLKAGDLFGVTASGEIYAAEGYIGGCKI